MLFKVLWVEASKEVFICGIGIAQYSSGIMTRLTWNAYFLSSHKIFKN